MVRSHLTAHDALCRLAAGQIWIRSGRAKDMTWYGAGHLRRIQNFENTLKHSGRKPVLRLANRHRCYACDTGVNPFATGDHIVPSAKGGPPSADNFAPMCAFCNSSKGDQDLIAWWLTKGGTLWSLDPDVTVQYCRVTYSRLVALEMLGSPAPEPVIRLLSQFADSLPTAEHTAAFNDIRAPAGVQMALWAVGR